MSRLRHSSLLKRLSSVGQTAREDRKERPIKHTVVRLVRETIETFDLTRKTIERGLSMCPSRRQDDSSHLVPPHLVQEPDEETPTLEIIN